MVDAELMAMGAELLAVGDEAELLEHVDLLAVAGPTTLADDPVVPHTRTKKQVLVCY